MEFSFAKLSIASLWQHYRTTEYISRPTERKHRPCLLNGFSIPACSAFSPQEIHLVGAVCGSQFSADAYQSSFARARIVRVLGTLETMKITCC